MTASRPDRRGPSFGTRVGAALRTLRRQDPVLEPAEARVGVPALLGEVGAALLAASQATTDVESTLRRLAVRYDQPQLRVFVLPTLVLVEDVGAAPAQTGIFPADGAALRLDQAGAVEHVVRRAFQERTPPEDVVREIARITAAPPRFGGFLTVVGYALLTVGFGLVLNPTLTALPVYVVLGVAVGTILLFGSRIQTLSLILPVFTAFAVTLVVSLVVRPIVHDDVLRLVAPSLVSFLPGLTLTIAAVELTSGQVMAGASRLVYGIARLGLLAFGVFAGISVAGEPVTSSSDTVQLGPWAPWVGIVLVALGYYLYSSAPRRSLVWIAYALLVSYAAQLLGNMLIGPELSGLVGAVIVVPAVYLAARVKAAPPTAIMLTCAYWLLVPGSMGFIGIAETAAGTAGGTETILKTFGSLIAIAIGMLIGGGLSKDATAIARAWRDGPRQDRTKTT